MSGSKTISNQIILLSYAFPPLASPESFLSAKALGALLDYEVDVISASPVENNLPLDHSLDVYVQNRFRKIIRLSPPRLVKAFATFRSLHQFPDYFQCLNQTVLKQLTTFNLSKYKAIVSWSQWHSIHLVGLAIKRKAQSIKWIAHFSDPWVDNPYANYGLLTSLVNKRMERSVIEHADAIIFTSPETIELVMRKHPQSLRNKVYYVPHCYDSNLYQKDLNPSGDQYIIRSIGNFYGHRSPKPFYEAIKILMQREPSLFDNVLIEFIGSMGKYYDLINQYPLAKQVFRFTNSVPYIQSIFLMQTSHCLLVIDAPGETSVFFPSKLVDYIGAERFVLAISPPGATERVVKEIGGLIANPMNIDDVVSALQIVLERRPQFLYDKTKSYENKTVCKQFVKIIESVL